MSDNPAWAIDEIARDLDLVVFDLELKPASDPETLKAERKLLRRRLERLRERLEDLSRKLS